MSVSTEREEKSYSSDNKVEINYICSLYTGFIYKCPSLVIIICFSFVGFLCYCFLKQNDFSITADDENYRWSEIPEVDKWDAFVDASKRTYSSIKEKNQLTDTIPTQTMQVSFGLLLYERPGKNLLEVSVLQEIWELEDKLWLSDGISDYCLKSSVPNEYDPSNNCKYFSSFIGVLKKTMMVLGYPNPSPKFLNETILQIVLSENNPNIDSIKSAFLSRDYDKSNRSEYLRTGLSFGFPLKGYKNRNDRNSEQMDKLSDWGLKFVEPISIFSDLSPQELKAYCFVPGTINIQISNVIKKELVWLGGSFGLSIIIVVCHLRSSFLSLMGMIGVFFSIPAAISVQYCLIGIKTFDALNVLGLFLICGIGSDSIFIYFDFYKQSKQFNIPNSKRLAYAIQKGSFATFVSCMTTAICFVSLYTSGSRTLRFFGVFCFLEVIFDWIFSVTWFAASLAIWSKIFENNDIDTNNKEDNISPIPHEISINDDLFAFIKDKPTYCINSSGIDVSTLNTYERFFHNYLSSFIYHYRFVISVVTVIITIFLTYHALQMESKSEMQFMANELPIQRGYTLSENVFQTSSFYSFGFNLVWGINQKVNVSSEDKLTINQYGSASYIPFNMNNHSFQQFLYDVCDLIESQKDIVNVNSENAVVCPIRLLKNFSILNSSSFPIPINDYERVMNGFPDYLSSNLGANEGEILAGLSSRDTIGFNVQTNQIAYIGMKANLILPSKMEPQYLRPIYEKVIQLEKEVNQLAPEGYKIGFSTSFSWIAMLTQENFIKATFTGIVSSLIFSVLVAFLSTLSILYTFFFAFSLSSVVFSIMGILELFGWGIGLSEAVMLTIASGFCTDYIIHTLLHMANDSSKSQYSKLQSALTVYCTPVSFAFLTTVGSAIFLFPSKIMIFPPFGTFLVLSSIFGIFHGFFILPAISSMIVPSKRDNLYLLCVKEKVSDLSDL